MLTWSDTPLDLDLADERSAAGRLPPDEVEWLRCTGAVLFVPLSASEGGTKQLLGALVLGAKRSEEPYSADDRALLSSIAAQVSLGLDVARLRRRQTAPADGVAGDGAADQPAGGRRAGALAGRRVPRRAARATTPTSPTCANDGTPLRRGRLPRSRGHEIPRGSCAGTRRHGRGLLRARHAARARRRHQGRARRVAERPRRAHALPPRGAAGGAPAASRASSRSSTTARCPTARRFW